MKRFILGAILATLLSLPIMADSYRDALSKYMQTGNVIDKTQYEQLLLPLAGQVFQENADQGAAILAEYFSDQMLEDLTDMFLPAFRNHMSEAELKRLGTLLSDPRFATIQQRASSVLNTLTQSPEFQTFTNDYQLALMQIIQGQTPQDMPLPASITKEYRNAFMQYYRSSKAEDIIMGSFRSMTEMLTQALRQSGTPNPEHVMEQMMEYTRRNIPSVMLSCSHNVLTLEDLQALNTIAATTEYQHAMDAVAEIAVDPIQMTLALLTRMSDWLYLHFPQYAAPFQESLNLMKMNLY